MLAGEQFSAICRHYETLHDGDSKVIGLQPKMCPAGYWTEGYGSVIRYNGQMLKGAANKGVAYQMSRIHTAEEAEAELQRVGAKYRAYVLKVGAPLKLSENMVQALTSFAYNCGEGAFVPGKAVYEAIKSGDKARIKRAFLLYNKSNGKVMDGLTSRRTTEAELFIDNQLNFYLHGKKI
jgi:lysozyme